MKFKIDFLFKTGAGYDDLISLIQSNPRYVFKVTKEDKTDKRTRKLKEMRWVEISHKQHAGVIKLPKNKGGYAVPPSATNPGA